MAFPDYTYDIYEDFEDAVGGTWSETDADANINSADTAAKYYGAKGLSLNWRGATEGYDTSYISLDLGATRDTFSLGFWYYVPTTTGATIAVIAMRTSATTGGGTTSSNIRFYFNRASGVYSMKLRNLAGDYSANIKTLPASGAFYWVTIKHVRNATSTLRVYDTAGDEVDAATECSVTASDNANRYLVWYTGAYDEDVNFFIDDVVVDYTDATYPLFGWETGGGGTVVPQIMTYYRRLRG